MIFKISEILDLKIILDIHDTIEQVNVLGKGKPKLTKKIEKECIEIKRGACTMKDKIEKKLDSLGKSLCHGKDKTKEVAHQALDKAKNIDVSKKEAALLGAGAAVVVLSLLHKCFSRK